MIEESAWRRRDVTEIRRGLSLITGEIRRGKTMWKEIRLLTNFESHEP